MIPGPLPLMTCIAAGLCYYCQQRQGKARDDGHETRVPCCEVCEEEMEREWRDRVV